MNNKWIPVTEKLPPDEERVLTFSASIPWNFSWASDDPCVVVGFHSVAYDGWLFTTDSNNARIDPTHWMPLPDAPKSEGEDVL